MATVITEGLEKHLEEITSIYALEVLEGTASFETDPPDIDQMRQRRAALLELGMPYLVALEGERVAGYSYAGPYRPRSAYRHTLENSVYVAPWARQRGVGLQLLTALIDITQKGPWRQMIAVIGGSGHEASIRLHEQAGFRHVGTLEEVGYKFDSWVDTVLMQRKLY